MVFILNDMTLMAMIYLRAKMITFMIRVGLPQVSRKLTLFHLIIFTL